MFNILHGEAGENGELAGLLSSLNINYTGCDVTGAVLSWNKDIAKTLVAAKGIKTPGAQILKDVNQLTISDKGPWIVKPTKEGSSVGLYYVKDKKELTYCVKKALQDVDSVLVEDFIAGTECTVAIIKDNVLPVIRIEPEVGLYDYQAKYESTGTKYFCPSGFNEELENALKNDALRAFNALGLKGWGRVDFIVDTDGNRWFLEANTTPGMTETSLVPKAAAAIGWSFDELVKQILSTAFTDKKTRNDNV
ncbi:MAG: D-alanine--D-alanine ligase [Alcanivoracaceae bacterium]|nr:D-alanine--D-alanine ligase [Alcanivoracaceae bacterium]